MSRGRRGAYKRRTIEIEDIAWPQNLQHELRALFHRLLKSMWPQEGERKKRSHQLDDLINHLHKKPRCRLSFVFEACHQACKMALVDRGRKDGRDEAREFMEEQKCLHERLTKDHHRFQRLLAKRTFPIGRDRVIEALERSKSFVEILSLVELEVPHPRESRVGRRSKKSWRVPAHKTLKAAGVSYRSEGLLQKLFGF